MNTHKCPTVLIAALLLVVGLMGWTAATVHERRAAASAHEAYVQRDARIVDRITRINRGATILDFGKSFASDLVRASDAAGIDFRLVMAVIEKESGWNPRAVGAAGEVGLMKMLPQTAALVAKRLNDPDFKPPTRAKAGGYADLGTLGDPQRAVQYGVAYLAWQVSEFGMNETAIRAYNRNPASARENRPLDRYAEDVAFKLVAIVHAVPR